MYHSVTDYIAGVLGSMSELVCVRLLLSVILKRPDAYFPLVRRETSVLPSFLAWFVFCKNLSA